MREQKGGTSTINYYVISCILIAVLFFTIANAVEPQINNQLDFFELIFILAYSAPAIFSFIVARRYGRSTIFGKTYLALGIGFSLTTIGATLFDYYQMIGIENPYPSWIDVFFAAFYPFAIYHLRTNIHFIRRTQKPELKRGHILLLILIPLGVTSLYTFGQLMSVDFRGNDLVGIVTFNHNPTIVSREEFVPADSTNDFSLALNMTITGIVTDSNNKPLDNMAIILTPNENVVTKMNSTVDGEYLFVVPVSLKGAIYDNDTTFNLTPRAVSQIRFTPMEEYDETFWKGFYTGIFFVAATTFTFSWAVIGAQVFRGSILGAPWGLLLVGIGLTTVADVSYYYTSIYYYDRTNPIIGIWVLGCMLVSYALYLHRKQL